jgi:hypothetical protein
LRAIYVFEAFAICLAVIGLSSELFRSDHDQKTVNLRQELEKTAGELESARSTIQNLTSKVTGYEQLKEDIAMTQTKLSNAESERKTLLEEIATLKGSKQSWLKIDSIDGLQNTPMRIFIIANNISYSYPVDTIWIEGEEGQELPDIEFPVAVQSENLVLRFFILAQQFGQETTSNPVKSSRIAQHGKGKNTMMSFIFHRSTFIASRRLPESESTMK